MSKNSVVFELSSEDEKKIENLDQVVKIQPLDRNPAYLAMVTIFHRKDIPLVRERDKQSVTASQKKPAFSEHMEELVRDFTALMIYYKGYFGEDGRVKRLRQELSEYGSDESWLTKNMKEVREAIEDKKKLLEENRRRSAAAESKNEDLPLLENQGDGTAAWLKDNANGPDPFAENEGLDTDEFMEKFTGEEK